MELWPRDDGTIAAIPAVLERVANRPFHQWTRESRQTIPKYFTFLAPLFVVAVAVVVVVVSLSLSLSLSFSLPPSLSIYEYK